MIVIVRRRLIGEPYFRVRCGLRRVHKHEATGYNYCCHHFVHNILRFVPVQLQSKPEHMNPE